MFEDDLQRDTVATEDTVISAAQTIDGFRKVLSDWGTVDKLSRDTADKLGTLAVNLNVLIREAERLTREIADAPGFAR